MNPIVCLFLFVGLRRGGPGGRYIQDIARTAPPANMLNPAQPPQPTPYLPPPTGANPVPLNPSQPTIPAQAPPQFFSPAAPPAGSSVYGDQQQQPHQPSAPQPPAKTPAAYDSSVPRGWNDPPPVSSSRKVRFIYLYVVWEGTETFTYHAGTSVIIVSRLSP